MSETTTATDMDEAAGDTPVRKARRLSARWQREAVTAVVRRVLGGVARICDQQGECVEVDGRPMLLAVQEKVILDDSDTTPGIRVRLTDKAARGANRRGDDAYTEVTLPWCVTPDAAWEAALAAWAATLPAWLAGRAAVPPDLNGYLCFNWQVAGRLRGLGHDATWGTSGVAVAGLHYVVAVHGLGTPPARGYTISLTIDKKHRGRDTDPVVLVGKAANFIASSMADKQAAVSAARARAEAARARAEFAAGLERSVPGAQVRVLDNGCLAATVRLHRVAGGHRNEEVVLPRGFEGEALAVVQAAAAEAAKILAAMDADLAAIRRRGQAHADAVALPAAGG